MLSFDFVFLVCLFLALTESRFLRKALLFYLKPLWIAFWDLAHLLLELFDSLETLTLVDLERELAFALFWHRI